MTTSVQTQWQPVNVYGESEYAAVIPLNSSTDTIFKINIAGSVENTTKDIAPSVVTVDNLANNGSVTLTYGPFTWTIPPYSQQTYQLPGANKVIGVSFTVGSIVVTLAERQYADNISNQLKIQQTATQVAQFPYVKYNTNQNQLSSDFNSVVQFTGAAGSTYSMLSIAGSPVANGAFSILENRGTATFSLVPNGANTINSIYTAAIPLVLSPDDSGELGCDGTNWFYRGKVTFKSAQQAWADGGTLVTLNHGLGVRPDYVDIFMDCITNDASTGWQAGDTLHFLHHVLNKAGGPTTGFATILTTATQILMRYTNLGLAGGINMISKAGADNVVGVIANFKFRVNATKFW